MALGGWTAPELLMRSHLISGSLRLTHSYISSDRLMQTQMLDSVGVERANSIREESRQGRRI